MQREEHSAGEVHLRMNEVYRDNFVCAQIVYENGVLVEHYKKGDWRS